MLRLCKNHSLKHFACSHRKKQFVRRVRRHGNKILEVHTGTIDSCWGLLKKNIPTQLTTCPQNQGELNHLIWTYVTTWQLRWETALVGFALLKKQAYTCPRCESNRLRLLKLGFRREKARYAANFQVIKSDKNTVITNDFGKRH